MTSVTHIATREQWLTLFAEKYLWPRIEAAGGKRPERCRMSVGFPKGKRGGKGHRIGECWSEEASADGTREIFVSPELGAFDIVHTLAHELVHAAVGLKCGHGAPFKRLALRIGLTGPMRSTIPSNEFETAIRMWLQAEPPYPHAPMTARSDSRKKGSRMLKASCKGCGYTVRLTRQWLQVAAPICPDSNCPSYQEGMSTEAVNAFKRSDETLHASPRAGCSAPNNDSPNGDSDGATPVVPFLTANGAFPKS